MSRPNRAQLLALCAAALIAPLAAHKAYAISVMTCGTTCTSDCELAKNLTCGPGDFGVTLAAGALLDMKGFYIACNGPGSDSCDRAVIMSGAGSTVFSSVAIGGSGLPSAIQGNWLRGVDCAANANSRVTGITFRGFFTDSYTGGAIYQCQTVDNNIVTGWPNPGTLSPDSAVGYFAGWTRNCIVHTSISNLDLIIDNHVDGCFSAVRRASGTLALTIDSNNVNCHDLWPGITAPCIDLASTSRPSTVSNNVMEGDTRGLVIQAPTSGATFHNNVCKLGMAGCSACVSQGRCVASGTTTSP